MEALSSGTSPKSDPTYEKWIQQALAGLQLPHMPGAESDQSSTSSSPTVRILLVSDVDLPSASALAEYTLLQKNKVFDASRIDLCIACGPLCRDEDLLPYQKGKQRKHLQQILDEDKTHGRGECRGTWSSSVFFRSPEETAAVEGLVTAVISQLESIVCRVVFCPGSTDPLTTSTTSEDLRFTPNSRNIHRKWLPLAPGLGCAGLLFLDSPTGVLRVTPPPRHQSQRIDYDSEDELDDEDDNFEEDETERHRHGSRTRSSSIKLTKIHGNEEMGPENYCRTLERLIRIAPPPQHHYPRTELSQTILVTHYFEANLKERRRTISDSDDDEEVDEDARIYINDEAAGAESGEDDDMAAGAVSQDITSDDSMIQDSQRDSDFGRPWPSEHSDFVGSSLIQEQLALEIASGGGASQKPKEMQKGNVRIVIPGSLRERGEFCLVDMSLMEQALKKNVAPTPPAKKKSTFAWCVRNVEFHTMERLP